MDENDVRELLRLHMKQHIGKRKGSTGFTAWCRKNGVNKGHASEFLNGKKGPQSDILAALNLVVRYHIAHQTAEQR